MPKNEGQTIEFKKEWRDDILKTVSGFANTDGGTIYIGIDDKGRSVPLKGPKKLLENISNKIKDILGIVADVRTIKKPRKQAIKITIKKYTAPISYKGAFHIRSGSTTTELKGIELSRFLLSRAGTTWDNVVEPKALLKDISVKTIRHFQQLAKTRFPFIAREKSVKLILQKLNLAEKGRLKRGAILLFGKDPKKYFTSAFIQAGRFISESEVVSTDLIEGNLFEQVEKTIEILRLKYLENRFYYEGIYRKEDLIYPEDALREAVINAVIHRDYMGPHTQLRVYDDKLWLWNTGKLSEEITFDKLKKPHSSYPRNELLADVFFKAGFIEAWGRGTLKIVEKCREKDLPEPEFSEMTGGFLVSFFKPKAPKVKEGIKEISGENTEKIRRKYGENAEKIILAISGDQFIRTHEIADKTKLSQSTVEKIIAKLKKDVILKRVGPDKGGYWSIPAQFEV